MGKRPLGKPSTSRLPLSEADDHPATVGLLGISRQHLLSRLVKRRRIRSAGERGVPRSGLSKLNTVTGIMTMPHSWSASNTWTSIVCDLPDRGGCHRPKDLPLGAKRKALMARTVIQITADPSYLSSLCDDGKIFRLLNHAWPLMTTIPRDDPPTAGSGINASATNSEAAHRGLEQPAATLGPTLGWELLAWLEVLADVSFGRLCDGREPGPPSGIGG